MDSTITATVNGQKRTITTDPDRPLLEVLREELHLTGARFGCGEGECGACSVLVDGQRVFSCSTAVSEVQGKTVQTIEGLAQGDKLHPVQQAFMEEGAFQCGYCTSGMIMNAMAMLNAKPNPSDAEIRDGMNNNLCRCCSYERISNAIRAAAKSKPTIEAGR
jgi:aerobic-type carbon monoxide dehydrogenase small subunit (CoxS/CutS family)